MTTINIPTDIEIREDNHADWAELVVNGGVVRRGHTQDVYEYLVQNLLGIKISLQTVDHPLGGLVVMTKIGQDLAYTCVSALLDVVSVGWSPVKAKGKPPAPTADNCNSWHAGLGYDGCDSCNALINLRQTAGFVPVDHLRP